ncbi:2534_t:CDS:1, partial [Acaulospora colombiana]
SGKITKPLLKFKIGNKFNPFTGTKKNQVPTEMKRKTEVVEISQVDTKNQKDMELENEKHNNRTDTKKDTMKPQNY